MNTNTAYKQYPATEYKMENKEITVDDPAGKYTRNHLQSALQTIDGAMNESPSLIWSCFELYLPDNRPAYFEYYSNNVVVKFLGSLKYRAAWKQKRLAGGNTVKRKANIDFVWNKNMTRNGKPFYRVILLLNREAYNHQGSLYHSDENTFFYRIYNTWAKELNITESAALKLIRFSGKKIGFISNGPEDLAMVFDKASILCQAPATDHGLGCYGFGTSR